MPSEARGALVAYLETRPLDVPRTVSAPPTGARDDEGSVLATFGVGEVFLRRREGGVLRLTWDAPPNDRVDGRRPLSAGTYDLIGYRIVREDEQGVRWHLSGSGRIQRGLVVEAGRVLRLDIAPGVQLRTRRMPRALSVSVQGYRNAGVSIYKDGRRIPMGYRLLGFGAAELLSGAMEYG